MLNRIIKIGEKEYEVKYTNRAKATLEGLENKTVYEIISEIVGVNGVVKIETAVNLVYSGIKYTEKGNITRDEIYDLLPQSTLDIAKTVIELFNVLFEDSGLSNFKEKKAGK